jgi:hypothetical protein
MQVDFSPKVQTALTIAGALFVVVVFALPRIGQHLIDKDPRSVLGRRLVLLGSDLRAFGSGPVGKYLPPPIRMALDSIPEVTIEVPAGVRVTVKSEPPKKDADATPVTRAPRESDL